MSLIDHVAYEHHIYRKNYRGLVLKSKHFQEYLSTRVNSKFYDYKGTLLLESSLTSVDTTGFNFKVLQSPFDSEEIPVDWKIGEKIAECFLEDYCNSIFPYNDSRDAKDSNSSLPGTDMVGFVEIENKPLFLFGEVKTSDQEKYPPSVIYGNDGLKTQLDELGKNPKKRKELIKWFGHKFTLLADNDVHKNMWTSAVIAYFTPSNEFKISGMMIRGTVPNKRDLESTFTNVILNMGGETYFELISLYIPIKKSQYVEIMGNKK